MYKHLYECFKHWYRGGTIYLYSDPHFSDEEMKELRKDYIGDDEQVERINSKLGKNDTIIFLGDIGNIEFIKKIKNCYKVLILGNHDRGASYYKREIKNYPMTSITPSDNGLFDEVYEGALMISDKILLTHEPTDFKYAFNIHGHDHSNWYKENNRHLNVCAEHLNYYPICLKDIVNSGKLKDVPNIHRDTIDRAINK